MNKQNFDIEFRQGIDAKNDSRLTIPGTLEDAVNVVLGPNGTIRNVPNFIPSGILPSDEHIGVFSWDGLPQPIVKDPNMPNRALWGVNKVPGPEPMIAETHELTGTRPMTYNGLAAESCSGGQFTCVVLPFGSSFQVQIVEHELASGKILRQSRIEDIPFAPASDLEYRLAYSSTAGVFLLAWIDANGILSSSINPVSGAVISTLVVPTAALPGKVLSFLSGDDPWLTYSRTDSGSGQALIETIDAVGTVIHVKKLPNTAISVSTCRIGSGLGVAVFHANSAGTLSEVTYVTPVLDAVYNTGAPVPDLVSGRFRGKVTIDVAKSSPSSGGCRFVWRSDGNSGGVNVTSAGVVSTFAFYGDPKTNVAQGRFGVEATHDNFKTEGGYLTAMHESGIPDSRLGMGETIALGNTVSFAMGRWWWVQTKRVEDFRTIGITDVTASKVVLMSMRPHPVTQVEFNGVTMFSGAMPAEFDGVALVESGVDYAPRQTSYPGGPIFITLPTYPAAGADPGGETYSVCATVMGYDAVGNRIESGPSNVMRISTDPLPPGGQLRSFQLSLPRMGRAYAVNVYRTRGDRIADTVFYTHTSNNSWITSSEPLYTVTGQEPNRPAPSCGHVAVVQQRVVMTGLMDARQVHRSRALSPGFAPEYGEGLDHVLFLQEPAIASAELDGRHVVVTGRGVHVVGQDASGKLAANILVDIPVEPQTFTCVAVVRAGMWFKAEVGLRMFGRNGELVRTQSGDYLGSNVDSQIGRGAVIDGKGIFAIHEHGEDRVWFLGNQGFSHVFEERWMQFTRAQTFGQVRGAVSIGRDLFVARTGEAALRKLNKNSPTGQSFVQCRVVTGWVKVSGLQGFQRVSRLQLLAKLRAAIALGPVPFDITTYYDYSEADSYRTEVVVTPDADGRVQFRHQLQKQKCEAIKFDIAWNAADDSELTLTGLSLLLGVNGAHFKSKEGV